MSLHPMVIRARKFPRLTDLARAANVDDSHLSRLEAGKVKRPGSHDPTLLARLEKAVGSDYVTGLLVLAAHNHHGAA